MIAETEKIVVKTVGGEEIVLDISKEAFEEYEYKLGDIFSDPPESKHRFKVIGVGGFPRTLWVFEIPLEPGIDEAFVLSLRTGENYNFAIAPLRAQSLDKI